MIAQDPFGQYYASLLDDTYDVVDRIVLNGYWQFGQRGGGFRTWWCQLYGHDDHLDNTHLMRMAGRFSRRVRGWAQKNDIAVITCHKDDRPHEIAERHRPAVCDFEGIFAVLVTRRPASVWQAKRFDNSGIDLRRKSPRPWVNHYSFHLVDHEWGHVAIKICGHVPFNAQIMLNGHEYVACRARRVDRLCQRRQWFHRSIQHHRLGQSRRYLAVADRGRASSSGLRTLDLQVLVFRHIVR